MTTAAAIPGVTFPMARGGGLFLMLIGGGLIAAIAFSGAALVNFNIFYVGIAMATTALCFSGQLSSGSPTRVQIAALAVAIGVEVVLLVVQGRTLPHGTSERVRWLWISMIVGAHFLPMALSFGWQMSLLGGLCIANAAAGLLLPGVPYEVFGLVDGALKVGVGARLLFPGSR